MRSLFTGVSALSLVFAQAAPVLAQDGAPAPMDRMARPAPQPANPPPPRPSTRPAKPGFGGSGGWQGGSTGGGWQGGNRPPPVRPPYPDNGWGGSGGSWNNGSNWGGRGGSWDNGNNWGGSGGSWNGGTVRCESRDGRYRTCNADTRGGVRLIRTLSNTPCRQGRTWGSSPGRIWVNNGCRGEFQTRYGGGGGNWGGNQDDGPSTGAVIGGVAVAAGLIALLASGSKKGSETRAAADALPPAGGAPPSGRPNPAPPAYVPPAGATGQPARIAVLTGSVAAAAEPSFRTCLNEAARQIGATGGTEIQLDRVTETVAGNGGYRFRLDLKGVYPDETRLIPTYCRATPTQVVELTFG